MITHRCRNSAINPSVVTTSAARRISGTSGNSNPSVGVGSVKSVMRCSLPNSSARSARLSARAALSATTASAQTPSAAAIARSNPGSTRIRSLNRPRTPAVSLPSSAPAPSSISAASASADARASSESRSRRSSWSRSRSSSTFALTAVTCC